MDEERLSFREGILPGKWLVDSEALYDRHMSDIPCNQTKIWWSRLYSKLAPAVDIAVYSASTKIKPSIVPGIVGCGS